MKESEILHHLRSTGALLHGHFLLRSGLHSDQYFQGALLLQHTLIASELCAVLAQPWQDSAIDLVLSPAIGGIIVGQELGRALKPRAVFAEKDDESGLILRRGFEIKPGERILIGEDVVTRGGRVQQAIDLARSYGGNVVGVATLIDRSAGQVDFGVPYRSLMQLNLPTYTPEECPMCQQGLPIDKPGSK